MTGLIPEPPPLALRKTGSSGLSLWQDHFSSVFQVRTLTIRDAPFSVSLSDLLPVWSILCFIIRQRWASNSDSFLLSIIVRWSRICGRSVRVDWQRRHIRDALLSYHGDACGSHSPWALSVCTECAAVFLGSLWEIHFCIA